MTLAFTICSINYLAQARTLGESLVATNPHVRFVVALVDKLDGIQFDPDKKLPFELLELETIGIVNLAWMSTNYDITELNTAVKPYFMDYLLRQDPEVNNLIYFDPDIIVFQPLTHLLTSLETNNIIVTPHTIAPFPDTLRPNESDLMNTGTYNLGFMALRRSTEATRFIQWWMDKLAYDCRIDLCNGLFVDQKWVNFVPHYFERVHIEKHPGYNAAYWNLHERNFSQTGEQWWVNETVPLLFFHFSGYGLNAPESVSKYQNRYTFESRPDIGPLFKLYAGKLELHDNAYYQQFRCAYLKPKKVIRLKRVRKAFRYPFEKLADWLETP
ncbi:MAG: glycosyl transferase [Cytophagaceae bacterium]|nr:glycosyl transferase [Cytophagaceae bacterium]